MLQFAKCKVRVILLEKREADVHSNEEKGAMTRF